MRGLTYLLRLAGATVVTTPGVASFTGAEPTDQTHERRQLDLGARGLDDGPDIALDLCVSDCGTGKVSATYQTAAKCEAKSKAKKAKYFARFKNISKEELCCPGYGRTGSKSTEAISLQKRIIKAIAAADKSVPYSLVSSRVSQVLSVALQKAVAYNTLDYRYTKLAKARVVGAASGFNDAGVPLVLGQAVAAGSDDWDADDDEL